MKKVLIGGIGNVLLGDDGVGPYIARLLTAYYQFEEGVEVVDLGTPALDLIDQISGKDAVILIDCINVDAPPGTVLLYHQADIMRNCPAVRMDPHSPALVETLLAADLFGVAPRDLLLVGIVGESYESGCDLSEAVNASIPQAIAEVLGEFERLSVSYRVREDPPDAGIWWTATHHAVPRIFAAQRDSRLRA
ncbi:MAG TPA: hydrogenase maturation protease [Terriglobales bacterium]|nr:hydrogenase maturation protease [Terriglobales bacterium]